jgi:hypothetical protein
MKEELKIRKSQKTWSVKEESRKTNQAATDAKQRPGFPTRNAGENLSDQKHVLISLVPSSF